MKIIKYILINYVIILILSGCHATNFTKIDRPINSVILTNNLDEGLWGLEAINYKSHVFKEFYGESDLNEITVAIIDSGVDYNHPDLAEYVVDGYDFVNDDDDPMDDNGHGTQLAGIIGGKYTGIAYGVNIMPIKVLDNRGFGRTDNLAKGILWAVDNGADIINLSIGRRKHESLDTSMSGKDSFNSIEYDALMYALLSDVTVVVVSGDFNVSELAYPAAYDYSEIDEKLVVVSAYNREKEKVAMANTSELIDFVAPGEFILTTTATKLDIGEYDYTNIDGDGYVFGQGTSYSAAFVSGYIAIIKAVHKDIDTNEIYDILVNSCVKFENEMQNNIFGYGSIDMEKLIESLRSSI